MGLWEFFHPRTRRLVQELREGEYEYEQLLFLSKALEELDEQVQREGAWFCAIELSELHINVAESFLEQLLEAGYEAVLLVQTRENYTHLLLGGWHPSLHLPDFGCRAVYYEEMREFGSLFDDFFEATKERRVYRENQFYHPKFLNHDLIRTLSLAHD